MSELVSCLMVTRNRLELAERAISCFAAQTWPDRELIIVDDGDDDYSAMVMPYVNNGLKVRYHRIQPEEGVRLGALRNRSIEYARGEWCMQWDDDEWYHPDRITRQMSARSGRAGVALKWVLVDLPQSPFGPISFRADTGIATPGTILFRRDAARYENLARNEDGLFMREIRRQGLGVLGRDDSHLFVRCHHGSNTWELDHFLKRLRRRPIDIGHWARTRLTGDVSHHPLAKLSPRELATIADLRAYSKRETVST